MRTVLVDADVLVYQASNAVQRTIEWEPGMFTVHGDLEQAKEIVDRKLVSICENLAADKLVLALSDYSDPWRKVIMPEIKANRANVAKPVLLHPLRDYLHERYNVYQRPTLEGDDVLGILSTHPTLLPGQKIVVTLDKDLKGVPGFFANLKELEDKGEDAIREITEHEADRFHLYQALAGDPSDGYSGCPGIGPKKAEKILDAALEEGTPWANPEQLRALYWEAIVKTYRKAGLGEEVALQNARVARICRYRDYDYSNKRVILWTPPAKSAGTAKGS
jgi:DNA polymerase-1